MDKYIYTVGRRKTSTATLRLFEGKSDNIIGQKKLEEVYPHLSDKAELLEPLKLVDGIGEYYFTVVVKGGGKRSQLGAIKHALSRALAKKDREYKKILKPHGLLTRDDRMKERKKTGLRKARKARQFSKR